MYEIIFRNIFGIAWNKILKSLREQVVGQVDAAVIS